MERIDFNLSISYYKESMKLSILEECLSGSIYKNVDVDEIGEIVKKYMESLVEDRIQ